MLINTDLDHKLRNQILKHALNGMILVGEPAGLLNIIKTIESRKMPKYSSEIFQF
jgi:cobyrinic acid a,c-diamide synthase